MTTPRPAAAFAAATNQLDDSALLARLRDGDSGLFELLMRRHNQMLFRTARSVVHDDSEAEDVVQAAWVKAWAALATFAGRASLATWLVKITLHEAISRRRRGRLFVSWGEAGMAEQDTTDAPSEEAPSPEALAGTSELRTTLTRSIDALPEPLRVVFVLRQVNGMSTQEAAEALAISPENVKVRLHRARALLRNDIERRVGREVRSLYGFDGARCDRLVAAVLARIGSADGPRPEQASAS